MRRRCGAQWAICEAQFECGLVEQAAAAIGIIVASQEPYGLGRISVFKSWMEAGDEYCV